MGKMECFLDRRYTEEFRRDAVHLAEAIGGSQAAKQLGISAWSLWNWIRLTRAWGASSAGGASAALRRWSDGEKAAGGHFLAGNPSSRDSVRSVGDEGDTDVWSDSKTGRRAA